MEKQEVDLFIFSEALGVDITKKTRAREVATARFTVFYKLSLCGMKLRETADLFGVKHQAVIHGIKEVKDKLSINDSLMVGYWEKVKDLKI